MSPIGPSAAKESVIRQRQGELEVTRRNLKMVGAAVDAAAAVVTMKQNEVAIALSTQSFREKGSNASKGMASGPSPAVTQDILLNGPSLPSRRWRRRQRRASVDKAKSGFGEARAKLEAANADIQLERVACRGCGRTVTRHRPYSNLGLSGRFDGVITRRVDPGSFVQNAATHRRLVDRGANDIVTVYMKVPTISPRWSV